MENKPIKHIECKCESCVKLHNDVQTHEHGRTVAPMPVRATGRRKAKAVQAMGSIDTAIYKRICSVLYKRWETINAKEVSILCGVALYLQCLGKRTAKRDDVLRWLGFRMAPAMRKQIRWMESLSENGYLLRVAWDAGTVTRRGHGYGLTEYGQAFLNDLDREYDIARQWVEDQNRTKDVVLYLDRLKEQLRPRQRALLTPKQIEQLRAIELSKGQ